MSSEMFSIADVEQRVAKIAALTGDSEVAHYEQDQLYLGLLKYFAANPGTFGQASRLAAVAIRVDEMHFARWYA